MPFLLLLQFQARLPSRSISPADFTFRVFMILTLIFVATTGDSMTYGVSSLISQSKAPSTALRVFWGIAIWLLTLILITIDEDSIANLQSFIVITAVPVSFLI